jgi:SET domain-containing protein
MPKLEGLRVGPSEIHGYGVYATRAFAKGEIVVVAADGVVYQESASFDDEYALVLPAYCEPGRPDVDLPLVYYDLADQTRWINHACDPNCEVECRWDLLPEPFVTPWWVALRDIAVGEEISYDYAFCGHLAVPCSCKSPRCRGVIVDPDEVDEVPAAFRHLVRHDVINRRGDRQHA